MITTENCLLRRRETIFFWGILGFNKANDITEKCIFPNKMYISDVYITTKVKANAAAFGFPKQP